jgi:hypothetical protein
MPQKAYKKREYTGYWGKGGKDLGDALRDSGYDGNDLEYIMKLLEPCAVKYINPQL